MPPGSKDRKARRFINDIRKRQQGLERRQGRVTAVNPAAGSADVQIGGDTTSIPGIPTAAGYQAGTGDDVWVDVQPNGQMNVLDRLPGFGSSAAAGLQTDMIITDETRTAGTYADLATVGPAVTVTVSASGKLMVGYSVLIELTNVNDGALVSVALSGANAQAASEERAVQLYTTDSDTITTMTRTMVINGLTPGDTTVTLKYRTKNGSSASHFSYRDLWVWPI